MISVVVHESDTVRIRIPELTHDVLGRVTEGDVTYSIYDDTTDELLESGSLGYTPAMGWSTITVLPNVDRSTRMRAVVVAAAYGSQKTFVELFTVRNA